MTVLPDFWPSQTSQQRDGLPMVAQASLWQSSNQDGSIYDPFPTPGIHHQRFSWRFRAPCRPSRQFSFPGNPHLYLSIQQSTLGLFFWFWAGIYHILHAPTKKYHSITCKSNMINQYLTTNKLKFLMMFTSINFSLENHLKLSETKEGNAFNFCIKLI